MLQNKLNGIFKWSNTWQLNISLSKRKVVHVGNVNRNVIMCLDSHVLVAGNEVRDLGVIVDLRLMFVTLFLIILYLAPIGANLIP